jgi:hypothetical protein
MWPVEDDCGNREFGAFGRRAVIFLFRIDRHAQDLIADLLRVMSAAISGCGICAYSLRENV